jgi:hypothetical protein
MIMKTSIKLGIFFINIRLMEKDGSGARIDRN